jgi:hypothetical protein
MKNIVSFGDSFIFGSELIDNSDGQKAWPGLIAKELNVPYTTCSVPGCGNDHIAQQIYSYFSENSTQDTLAIINWTWANRWDFYIVEHETWITVGSTCVPEKLQHLVSKTQAQDIIEFYKSRINSSLLWNKVRSLQTIYAAQSYLKQNNILNIQTYMDYILFDRQFHAPDYVQTLQDLTFHDMQLFEGLNFLDWARHNEFKITKGGWHPLESAHEAAQKLWVDKYSMLLK